MIKSINSLEFKEKLNTGEYILIDIRTIQEFNIQKIDGAILIDFYDSDFQDRLDLLDKTKKYLIYCRTGARTSYTLNIFEELGFNDVYDLKSGIINY